MWEENKDVIIRSRVRPINGVIEKRLWAVCLGGERVFLCLSKDRFPACRNSSWICTLLPESCCPLTVNHGAVGGVQELLKSELVFPDKQAIPGHQLLTGVRIRPSPAINLGAFSEAHGAYFTQLAFRTLLQQVCHGKKTAGSGHEYVQKHSLQRAPLIQQSWGHYRKKASFKSVYDTTLLHWLQLLGCCSCSHLSVSNKKKRPAGSEKARSGVCRFLPTKCKAQTQSWSEPLVGRHLCPAERRSPLANTDKVSETGSIFWAGFSAADRKVNSFRRSLDQQQ